MPAGPITFALNHIVSPRLSLAELARLAGELGISAVEIRDDMPGAAIADGTGAAGVRALAEAHGLAVLSINALYPFDVWSADLAEKARRLAAYARDCGAQALVMCPLNSTDDRRDERQRAQDLRRSLRELLPILQDGGIVGLVEPLGFPESALRLKRTAVDAIDEVGGASVYRLVHDTFHHYLASEDEIFPDRTGLVHISGVEDASLPRAAIRDEHRMLVGPADLMDNVGQIRTLLERGYRGPFSFEPFSPCVHELPDLAGALRASMMLVEQGCASGA